MQNIAIKGKIGEDKIEVKISKNSSKNTIIYLLIKKTIFLKLYGFFIFHPTKIRFLSLTLLLKNKHNVIIY